VKDKKYLPLLKDFDYEKPYNTIDLKKKVCKFEEEQKNKFKNCEFFDDYFVTIQWSLSKLPFSDDEVYQTCTLILTVVASVVAWWKNNSFSRSALKADKYMKELKAESRK
jgi:SPP1 family holin